MTEKVDLKELEKKAWKSTFQDGLWDIYFGLIIMGMGIYTIPQFFGFDNTFTLIMILMIWDFTSCAFFVIAKKLITIPRIGFVRFSKIRVMKKIKLTIFLSFMVGLNVVFLLLPFSGLNIRLNAFTTMLMSGFWEAGNGVLFSKDGTHDFFDFLDFLPSVFAGFLMVGLLSNNYDFILLRNLILIYISTVLIFLLLNILLGRKIIIKK